MHDTCDEPRAIGSPSRAFTLAMKMIQNAGAKNILDCPAGEGPFSKILLSHGFDVVAADVCPEQFRLDEIDCDFVDLNEKLPYDDHSFDAIACLNGLQRVWARGRAVNEFARVLKPGGTIVISFPNNSDIRRRLMFLLTGSVTWNVIGPPHVCLPNATNPASCFRYPMTLTNVLSALSSVGLNCDEIRSTHYTKGAILLSPLALGSFLFSLLSPKQYQSIYDKELFKIKENSSLDALLGEFLIVRATKPA